MKNSIAIFHEDFECGCTIIKRDNWSWEIVNCIGHSKYVNDKYQRITYLKKPVMESIHP